MEEKEEAKNKAKDGLAKMKKIEKKNIEMHSIRLNSKTIIFSNKKDRLDDYINYQSKIRVV